MALVDKYVLLFDDVYGNKKKLVIQKEGHSSGDGLYDIIGTGNPVILNYESQDDIYYPIIGSSCDINLYEERPNKNFVRYSTQLNVSGTWIPRQSTTVVSTNSFAPPFEHINQTSTNESELVRGGAFLSGSRLEQNLSGIEANTTYCASVYIKKSFGTGFAVDYAHISWGTDETNFFAVDYTYSTGVLEESTYGTGTIVSKGVESVGNGWYRIYVAGTTGSTVTNPQVFINYNAKYDSMQSHYWGVQVNEGIAPTRWIYTGNSVRDNDISDLKYFEERDFRAILYNEVSGTYNEFWRGYLKADAFIESFQPRPTVLKLYATDGLGELDSTFITRAQNTFSGTSPSGSAIKRICQIIEYTGLELPIRYSNFIQTLPSSTFSFLILDSLAHLGIYSGNFEIRNNKEILVDLLKQHQLRIFQSKGYFYIVSVFEYVDWDLLDDMSTYAVANSAIPTGLRDAEKANLTTNGTEYPKFINYALDGTKGTEIQTIDILKEVNTDLIPVNRDLVMELREPAAQVEVEEIIEGFDLVASVGGAGKRLITTDAGNEEATGKWTAFGSKTSISDDIVFKLGNRSIKITEPNTTLNTLIAQNVYTNNDLVVIKENETLTFRIQVFIDCFTKGVSTTNYQEAEIKFAIRRFLNGTGTGQYYTGSGWQTLLSVQTLKAKATDKWISLTQTITPTLNNAYKYTIELYEPRQVFVSSNTPDIYLDNIYLDRFSEKLTNIFAKRKQDVKGKVYELDYKSQTGAGFGIGGVRPRENFAGGIKSAGELSTLQIMNDNRTPMKVYSGTFRYDDEDVVTPLNKLWFNFTDYQADVSAMIDKLRYDIKNAEYKISAHEPNQDDDVTSDYIEGFS